MSFDIADGPPPPLRRPRKPDGSWPDSWYGALFVRLTEGDAVLYGHSEWPSYTEWLVPGAEGKTRAPDP